MAAPARQRILDAALELIRERGIGRVTTKEIASSAGAAEGSLFKNFGDKMGLLAELLAYELPENRAWREVPVIAPPGRGELVPALVLLMGRAIDFFVAALPLVAGSFADRELLRRHQEVNRERQGGPQLAIDGTANYLKGWQEAGYLDPSMDSYAMALSLCGSALIYAYTQHLGGAEFLRGGRDELIHDVIRTVVGPHRSEPPPPG
jgi:AcrR family transcriptional regulator